MMPSSRLDVTVIDLMMPSSRLDSTDMLTFSLIAAFAVVALPSYLYTSLSLLRTVAVLAAGGTLLLLLEADYLTSYHDVDNLFTGDTLGLTLMVVILLSAVASLSHWSAKVNADKTPIALGVLLLFTMTGSVYLVGANNLVTLILALELQGFAVYAVAAIYRWRKDATAAGLMYFLLSALSSTLLILGLAYIFSQTGETSFMAIKAIAIDSSGGTPTLTVGLSLLTVGALFKVTAAPFHYWGPDVYDGVPSAVTAWLAILPKYAVLVFLARLSSLVVSNSWDSLVLLSALLSFGMGSVVGLAQVRIKRLLAYSTVSHMGFILVALVVGTANGLGSYGYYVAQYGLVSLLSLLVVIAIGNAQTMGATADSDRASTASPDLVLISSFSGLWSRVGVLAVALAIALYSSAGVPPLVGFYAKWSVITSAAYSEQWLLAIAGLASSVASAGFYLAVVVTMYFNSYSTTGAINTGSSSSPAAPSVNNTSTLMTGRTSSALLSLITILAVTPILASVLVVINLLLAPYRPMDSKKGTYECGLLARSDQTRTQYSIIFYLVAVLFTIFDVEVTLLWPLAVVLGTVGFYGYWIAVLFFAVLTIGFVIELASGVIRFS